MMKSKTIVLGGDVFCGCSRFFYIDKIRMSEEVNHK